MGKPATSHGSGASGVPFSTAGMILGDGSAEDVVHELEVAPARQRLHADLQSANWP